nr:MAG TPA: hypothetical protein [Caudoviricetes sp.]DAU59270.1 MAG TPA: hypothetical protein [Crassvirales sp.]
MDFIRLLKVRFIVYRIYSLYIMLLLIIISLEKKL